MSYTLTLAQQDRLDRLTAAVNANRAQTRAQIPDLYIPACTSEETLDLILAAYECWERLERSVGIMKNPGRTVF